MRTNGQHRLIIGRRDGLARMAALPVALLLAPLGSMAQLVQENSEQPPEEVRRRRPAARLSGRGTLRFLGETRGIARLFVHQKPEPLIEALLWIAIYQLRHSKTASHVVVSQAVAAVAEVNRAAKGFANAVLRNYLRGPEEALARACERDEALWNHPSWWIGRLQQEQPEWWEAILRGGNGSGPLTLRVNRRRTTAESVNAALAAKKIDAELLSDSMIVLRRPRPVERLPGFRAGDFSVQDAGAQLAAPLLGAKAGMRVLDACAAPGGKAAHLLELADIDLLALDVDATRCQRIRENFSRLELRADVRAADAAEPATWWDGRPFDRILLDAPCTGSGVVRRHPDGKWLKRESDIAQLAAQQRRLIDALWPLLAPGGRLLYATCSVFRAEGQGQIDAFLQRHPEARVPAEPPSPGHLLPLPDNGPDRPAQSFAAVPDGFFYQLLEKT